jgi:biopolymer transport protein ExbD
MTIATLSAEAPMADLNTTPLIDVMLVLLVMFIITLPIQTHSVEIDLPGPGPQREIESDINRLSISASGAVLWNGEPVPMSALAGLLERTRRITPSPELRFEPDPEADYLVADQVIAIIKRSGVRGVGFPGIERYAREF